ncbi:putative membrane protein [Senna tora]|uniref:Putative membrane protein n=1 Tax=Senna tora TaxID=362788 RepID=A0A834SQC3_9FABA|nr:putative membrane protein [Senna tora]
MEPPKGFWSSLWNFIRFLPFFLGLLLLGNIKGVIFCPLICLIITIGNSAIIIGLWAAHSLWTYYCVLRAKQLGPVLKLVICTCVLPVLLIMWPVVGIVGSIIGGAAYGFLSPIFATFDAVGEGKSNKFSHCITDGTWNTIKESLTVVTEVKNMCYTSYFSIMDDLRQKGPPDVKYLEIRLLYLPGAVIVGVLGIIVDMPVISCVALFKGPYMLFKGWNRLFHDLIGREGPFLETICVPFAGLAILLWPLAVAGAVLASMIASILLGAFAGVVAYQESSFLLGLRYIIAAMSIYDEYSNDVLDMPEGSCFPRPQYRREAESSRSSSRAPSFSKPNSFKKTYSRALSMKNTIGELKPLELLDGLFKECHNAGERMVSEGLITWQDIEEAKSGKGSRVISIGLPAYCLLQALLRSAKANSNGILISDDTELTAANRPAEKFFDWFLNPLLIFKDQIKAENLTASEEDYLCKLVLLSGDLERLKSSSVGPAPESERKRAELDGFARRLQGITKSMSRFPTFKRRFDYLVKSLSDDLAEKHGAQTLSRSKSAFARMISLNSFKAKRTNNGSSLQGSEHVRDLEIS